MRSPQFNFFVLGPMGVAEDPAGRPAEREPRKTHKYFNALTSTLKNAGVVYNGTRRIDVMVRRNY